MTSPRPRSRVEQAACFLLALPIYAAACLGLVWHLWKLAMVATVPFTRRFVRACILAFCTPRPIDGRLYEFCQAKE